MSFILNEIGWEGKVIYQPNSFSYIQLLFRATPKPTNKPELQVRLDQAA